MIKRAVIEAVRIAHRAGLTNRAGVMHRVYVMATSPLWSLLV
jgi:hypothetical protein